MVAIGTHIIRRHKRTYVSVTATALVCGDKRTITIPLESIVGIHAISIDKITYEIWGLELQTRSATHHLDEELKGFEMAVTRLGNYFGFDAKSVIASANAALIKKPFDRFRCTVWTASAN
ncbi:hypothetical protein [Glycocaulis sp.]|uniref:hypothetical protein n=1 Tax=Glycocaulis sp. TaxID=1969725 RepID=UPI003F6EA6A8